MERETFQYTHFSVHVRGRPHLWTISVPICGRPHMWTLSVHICGLPLSWSLSVHVCGHQRMSTIVVTPSDHVCRRPISQNPLLL